MDIDKYTNSELLDELKKVRQEFAFWSEGDKRTRRVRYELTWAKAIIARDEAELMRRNVNID